MLKISGKYFGTKISGLWRTSRAIAGSKNITLTARGFVDENRMYIKGTETTAAIILSRAKLGEACVNFDFSLLKAPEIRDIIRDIVRRDESGELLLRYSSGKIMNEAAFMRFAEPLYDMGIFRASAKSFYEKSIVDQAIITACWGSVPCGLFFMACMTGYLQINDPEIKTFWLLGSGMLISGILSTYKMAYHRNVLRENAIISMIRILSDAGKMANILENLGSHKTNHDERLGHILEESKKIALKAKELLATRIELPEDKRSIERLKNYLDGRLSVRRIKNDFYFKNIVNGPLFDVLELIENFRDILSELERHKVTARVPGIVGNDLISELQKIRQDFETSIRLLELSLLDLFKAHL